MCVCLLTNNVGIFTSKEGEEHNIRRHLAISNSSLLVITLAPSKVSKKKQLFAHILLATYMIVQSLQ